MAKAKRRAIRFARMIGDKNDFSASVRKRKGKNVTDGVDTKR